MVAREKTAVPVPMVGQGKMVVEVVMEALA
jgi:hypothetical protein